MKKAFTLIELVIVIGIIGILAAVLIPKMISTTKTEESKIVSIYNQKPNIVRIFNGHEITEEESKSYKLDHYELENNMIYLYFIDKGETNNG